MRTISSTDLARHTRDILDEVASQGVGILVEGNHTPIARIVPLERTMTAAQALAGLGLPALTPNQAAEWLEDSKGG